MRPVFTSLLLVFSLSSPAQNKYTLSGYIRDSLSGETLIGASVLISGQTKGIASNGYGFYSITLPEEAYTVSVSVTGSQPLDSLIGLTGNREINFNLLQRAMMQE